MFNKGSGLSGEGRTRLLQAATALAVDRRAGASRCCLDGQEYRLLRRAEQNE
jgi:hypothetical protein